jgi:hypothetical protein
MKRSLFLFLTLLNPVFSQYKEIESPQELQSILLNKSDKIIAVGMWPCIPCEKLKKKLIEDQKQLPDVFWIDLKKHPRMRHVFNFKAIPYVAVYSQGDLSVQLTGEKNCKEYLTSIQY